MNELTAVWCERVLRVKNLRWMRNQILDSSIFCLFFSLEKTAPKIYLGNDKSCKKVVLPVGHNRSNKTLRYILPARIASPIFDNIKMYQ